MIRKNQAGRRLTAVSGNLSETGIVQLVCVEDPKQKCVRSARAKRKDEFQSLAGPNTDGP